MAATLLSGDFLWVTLLAAFVGVVVAETGFCLKTDRRVGRLAVLGSSIFSMAVITGFIGYKIFYPPELTPFVYVKRTNATVRTGNMKSAFELKYKYIAGCKDPSDTLLWIEIATGGTRREHPSTLADFQAQYFHDCGFYAIDTREFVEGSAATFGGVDMLCIKDFFNTNICHWIPASAIELDPPELEQR
jgi:hypothetical protein